MYGCIVLRLDTPEPCLNDYYNLCPQGSWECPHSFATLRQGSAQPRVLRGGGAGCVEPPARGHPPRRRPSKPARRLNFSTALPCPPRLGSLGEGGREGAAGRAPASGRAAAAAPVSCRRNARRYAPVSRSGSPSLLEHSSAYITRWQQSTFPEVS